MKDIIEKNNDLEIELVARDCKNSEYLIIY